MEVPDNNYDGRYDDIDNRTGADYNPRVHDNNPIDADDHGGRVHHHHYRPQHHNNGYGNVTHHYHPPADDDPSGGHHFKHKACGDNHCPHSVIDRATNNNAGWSGGAPAYGSTSVSLRSDSSEPGSNRRFLEEEEAGGDSRRRFVRRTFGKFRNLLK